MTGVDPDRLDDQQLMRELETIHRTRHDTLLHGSNDALRIHSEPYAVRRSPSTAWGVRRRRGPSVPPRGPGWVSGDRDFACAGWRSDRASG